MKKINFTPWLISTTLLFALLFSAVNVLAGDSKAEIKVEKKAEINWLPYGQALKTAKKDNKQVMIHFTAKWCGWCRKMERETYTDPKVINYLNENFVTVQIDGDSREELDIDGYKITKRDLTKKEFGVTGYPAFWFLESDGTKIGPVRGYKPTDQFMEALAYIKERKYETPDESKGEN